MTTPIRNPDAVSEADFGPLGQQGCLSAYSRSGFGHSINQDQLGWGPGFIAVTDGVGSGALPELASLILLEALRTLRWPNPQSLDALLKKADKDIAFALSRRGLGAGASVFAAAWIDDGADGQHPVQIRVAHAGDCKLLHLRPTPSGAWNIIWQTIDQSYTQLGIPPPTGISAASPANMIGCGMSAPASCNTLLMEPGDRLLLCSDGAQPLLNPNWLTQWMKCFPAPLTPPVAQVWCEKAMNLGNQDDVSILLLEYRPSDTRQGKARSWWRQWG